MRAQDAYTKTEYDKAEFLLIAPDTEKSHVLKNTWLASLAMVPTYVAILSNITHIFNMETSYIWLSIGLFLFILYQYIHIYKIYKSYCFPHEPCEVSTESTTWLSFWCGMKILKVQSWKLYNNIYMIASRQITNTESFSFIAVLFFSLLNRKVLLITKKQNRNY